MLIMLAEKIAEETGIVKLQLIDADLGQRAGELLLFVFHSFSPMSWTTISRVRGRLSKSSRTTCCQVPRQS